MQRWLVFQFLVQQCVPEYLAAWLSCHIIGNEALSLCLSLNLAYRPLPTDGHIETR